MPVFPYKCAACDATVEVLQDSEKQHLPTVEDFAAPCPAVGKEPGDDVPSIHDWRKVFGRFSVAKGPRWGGGKGNWAK